MDTTYLPRLIRDRVLESLADTPVVCLLGPRQVVQRAPELLLAIKSVVDRDRQPGRFLLTGSANLLLLPKAQLPTKRASSFEAAC